MRLPSFYNFSSPRLFPSSNTMSPYDFVTSKCQVSVVKWILIGMWGLLWQKWRHLVTARHQRHPANPLNGDRTLVSTCSSLYWWTSTTSLDSNLGNPGRNSATSNPLCFCPLLCLFYPRTYPPCFSRLWNWFPNLICPEIGFQQAVFFLDTHKL